MVQTTEALFHRVKEVHVRPVDDGRGTLMNIASDSAPPVMLARTAPACAPPITLANTVPASVDNDVSSAPLLVLDSAGQVICVMDSSPAPCVSSKGTY
jgi:hypothetical protein